MNKNVVIVGCLVALAILASKVSTEYREIKSKTIEMADEVKQTLARANKSLEVADDAKRTLANVDKMIADFRGRILRSEDTAAKVAEKECVCGPNCQCNAGGGPCPCPPVKAEPTVEPIGPKIKMHSKPNCESCDKWKRDSMPGWKSKGWAVEVAEGGDEKQTYPWFEICEGGKCYKVIGPLTAESYLKAKK